MKGGIPLRNEPILLNEALLLGRGGHKDVYADPTNFTRCIKILHDENDLDWKRELRYRRSRELRGLHSKMLPAYYGPLETNLGCGYVFERIFDFDGTPSLSFDAALARAIKENRPMDELRQMLEDGLLKLYWDMREEQLLISNVEFQNFLIQRTARDVYRVRIVDNIGSPVAIPLMFYIGFLARAHIDRYWRRHVSLLRETYPDLITEDMKKRLLQFI